MPKIFSGQWDILPYQFSVSGKAKENMETVKRSSNNDRVSAI